jgi:hypothetical protein
MFIKDYTYNTPEEDWNTIHFLNFFTFYYNPDYISVIR